MNTFSFRQKGFSLLEILVAFAILAIALGVIYQIFSRGSRTVILADEYAAATIIAESKLAALGVDTSLLLNDTHGTEAEKYHWSTSIQPYASEGISAYTTGVELHRATARVAWDSMGKERIVEINTLKLLVED